MNDINIRLKKLDDGHISIIASADFFDIKSSAEDIVELNKEVTRIMEKWHNDTRSLSQSPHPDVEGLKEVA